MMGYSERQCDKADDLKLSRLQKWRVTFKFVRKLLYCFNLKRHRSYNRDS